MKMFKKSLNVEQAEKKLEQYKQKCNNVSMMDDIKRPKTISWLLSYRNTKTWTTVKETTDWMGKSWGRNR